MYSFYISQNGSIDRKGNTLYFTGENFKRHLPVLNVSDIIISSKVSLSSWALDYLAKLGIIVHFLGSDGTYRASIVPNNRKEKGNSTVSQSLAYSDPLKRMVIASEFVEGIKHNILRNVRYYNKNESLSDAVEMISGITVSGTSIEQIMGCEGKIWASYYGTFRKIYNLDHDFVRTFHPPGDNLNSMISYGNALLYSSTLSAIMFVGLNPSVSFLHEPSDRSFSLALDIADVFKPVIVERVISTLIKNRIIKDNMFEENNGGTYLNERGRKLFLEAYRDKMESTATINGRHVSYATMIEMECQKLRDHVLGNGEYRSFRAWD
ncbi:MAG: type I-B CRISPR-associated endonuclease Cas1b [Thermoplasmatales archaeon]